MWLKVQQWFEDWRLGFEMWLDDVQYRLSTVEVCPREQNGYVCHNTPHCIATHKRVPRE